ncbi:hypothetical protein N7931_19060 [Catenovulum sp. 2E275]|uniref:hypothetical protein n=1 Tax=Catenovulum sp. 2E275 TaxID=2980497 RepID=UPI0021CEFC2C|nr:hypothetical protein [Catenovulum sp. 2E275]MCU4677712.1 hypothetical protein [Catenovulum sp. 2E275]
MLSEKPKYLLITQKLGLKLPLAWCVTALIIGLVTQDKVAAIFITLASFLASWLTHKIASFFFSFQEHSGILKNHVYDNVMKAIWFISLFCLLVGFSRSILFQSGSEAFLGCVFSIVYFGFMLSASNRWGMHFVEKSV